MAGIIPFTLERRRRKLTYSRCQHTKLVVDMEARTLECKECGQHVDPLQHLLDMGDRKRAWYAHKFKQERPAGVNELLTGMSNTASRRTALHNYLQKLEGHLYIVDTEREDG